MLRRFDLIKVITVLNCLALIAIIWMYPIAVAAQEGGVVAESSAAQEIMLLVVKAVFSILALLTTYLVTKAIGYFEKKLGVDIPDTTEALLNEWADKGIGLAYEKSHQQLKKLGKKLKGPEKMEIALKFVIGMAKEYKLPELAEDKLKDYIEGKLGLKRGEGVTLEQPAEVNLPPGSVPITPPA